MSDQPDLSPLPAEHYQKMLEYASDAVIFADRDGIIRFWNERASALFGFGHAEALGASLDLIIPERLRAAHWRGFDAALAAARPLHGAEARVTRGLHKEGEARRLYVEMSFGVVLDAAGAPIGSVAVARDVSERHAAERTLKTRLAELENQQSAG